MSIERMVNAAGDAGTAIALALAALPDVTSEVARPYVPEPQSQLDRARRELRERVAEHPAIPQRSLIPAARYRSTLRQRIWPAQGGYGAISRYRVAGAFLRG